jgi:hypothetical protein
VVTGAHDPCRLRFGGLFQIRREATVGEGSDGDVEAVAESGAMRAVVRGSDGGTAASRCGGLVEVRVSGGGDEDEL